MTGTPVFVTLLIIAGLGIILGAYFYFNPESVVRRRVKDSHWKAAKKDGEFRKWLEKEIQTQVRKTRRLGMMIIVIEAIWMVLVLSLWQKSGGQ